MARLFFNEELVSQVTIRHLENEEESEYHLDNQDTEYDEIRAFLHAGGIFVYNKRNGKVVNTHFINPDKILDCSVDKEESS